MALIGPFFDQENPTDYTVAKFTFWMPQFKAFMATEDGLECFNNIYPIAYARVKYGIMGADWYMAMSWVIAHYITLIGQQAQAEGGPDITQIAGGGVTKGVLTGMSVGGYSKQYDLAKTMSDEQEALFWNQTSYGAQYYALLKSKPIPSMFVVTSGPVPFGTRGNYRM